MKIRFFLFLLLLFSFFHLLAQKRFEYTPEARQAYDKVLSLRFQEANKLLTQIKSKDPDNLVVYHIENYIDFFSIYINEDEREFHRLKKNKARRLEKLESVDTDSPYYLYAQADVRLQWALARLKFEEYFTAFREVSKAYKLLKKNQKKHPDFMPNLKNLGVLHALVGTIPDNYKWGVKLLGGMEGSIADGRMELEEVLEYSKTNDFIFETETLVLYSFLRLHLAKEGDVAWKLINSKKLQPAKNPLHCFIVANIAMRTDRNDDAIRILEAKPTEEVFSPFSYLEFMLGLAKLRILDTSAKVHFQTFLDQYPGKNYIKEAYQKLAWCHLIEKDYIAYKKHMEHCLTKGSYMVGADKNAYKEAKEGHLPEVALVQARLLFDGGYFEQAAEFLLKDQPKNYREEKSKLEYTYRLGRIMHGMGKFDKALDYYDLTIKNGREKSWFFACNAALQAGLLHEGEANFSRAKSYYKECLDISPDEYKSSLHQQAKAGIARIRKENQ